MFSCVVSWITSRPCFKIVLELASSPSLQAPSTATKHSRGGLPPLEAPSLPRSAQRFASSSRGAERTRFHVSELCGVLKPTQLIVKVLQEEDPEMDFFVRDPDKNTDKQDAPRNSTA